MLLLLLPWLLLEQRPADFSFQHGDGAVRVKKCSQEGQGIGTTGHQWPICCLPDQGKAGFLGYKWHQGHPFQTWSWTDSALGKCGLCCVLLS